MFLVRPQNACIMQMFKQCYSFWWISIRKTSVWRRKHMEAGWGGISGEFAIVVVNCVYTTQVCGMMKTEITSLSLFVALQLYSRSQTSNCCSFHLLLPMCKSSLKYQYMSISIILSHMTRLLQNNHHYTPPAYPLLQCEAATWCLLYSRCHLRVQAHTVGNAHSAGVVCLVGTVFLQLSAHQNSSS